MSSKCLSVSKPQVRSMIVFRGWGVLDRLVRNVLASTWSQYREAKEYAVFLSNGEDYLVLPDGKRCPRYAPVRLRIEFEFPRKYMNVRRKAINPRDREVSSNGQPHDQ